MDNRSKLLRVSIVVLLAVIAAWSGFQLFAVARSDIHAREGLAALKAEDYDQALKLFGKALGKGSSRSDYYYYYAQTLGQISKASQARVVMSAFMQEAKEAYQRAIKINPHEGNYWVGLAHCSWWLSKLDKHEGEQKNVEAYLKEALTLDPANGKYLYAAINYYLAENRMDAALPLVKRLAQAHPRSYESLRNHPKWKGPVQFSFKEGLLAAVNSDMVDFQANAYLARMSADLGEWTEAVKYAQEVIRLSAPHTDPWWYSTLGGYYLSAGQTDKAVNSFYKSIMTTQDRLRSINIVFWKFSSSGNMEPFITLSEKVAEKDPRVGRSLDLVKGTAYFIKGDLDQAEKHLKDSVKAKETAEGHGYLARIALKRKDWEAAQKEAEQALNLDSKESSYYYLLALSLKEQDRLLPALEAMTQAINRDKEGTSYYYGNRGWFYWLLKRPTDAIKDWKTANRLDPSNAEYYSHLGMAHKLLKDYSSAERYLQSALDLKPDDKRIRDDLKDLQELKLDSDKAAPKQ